MDIWHCNRLRLCLIQVPGVRCLAAANLILLGARCSSDPKAVAAVIERALALERRRPPALFRLCPPTQLPAALWTAHEMCPLLFALSTSLSPAERKGDGGLWLHFHPQVMGPILPAQPSHLLPHLKNDCTSFHTNPHRTSFIFCSDTSGVRRA